MELLLSINKVYYLVIEEENNNTAILIPSSLDESSILVNAFEARKPQG